jgi:hypothetical protein
MHFIADKCVFSRSAHALEYQERRAWKNACMRRRSPVLASRKSESAAEADFAALHRSGSRCFSGVLAVGRSREHKPGRKPGFLAKPGRIPGRALCIAPEQAFVAPRSIFSGRSVRSEARFFLSSVVDRAPLFLQTTHTRGPLSFRCSRTFSARGVVSRVWTLAWTVLFPAYGHHFYTSAC